MERPLIRILPSTLKATSGVFLVLSISRLSIIDNNGAVFTYIVYTPRQVTYFCRLFKITIQCNKFIINIGYLESHCNEKHDFAPRVDLPYARLFA
jgi:hypothetical protein